MSRFINTELKSDSDRQPDSEVESKFDAELMAKLKSDFDSDLLNLGKSKKIVILLTSSKLNIKLP